MQPVSVIGIFCEDIRDEKSGQVTVIGMMPDNLGVSRFPCIIPKIGVLVRIHLDINFEPIPITCSIFFPDGAEMTSAIIDKNSISKYTSDAKAVGAPFVGLIMRLVISPLKINEPGRILAIVKMDEEELTCGALNVMRGE